MMVRDFPEGEIAMLEAIAQRVKDMDQAEQDRKDLRLERAERVVEAARDSQTAIYQARCLLCDAQRLRNRENADKVAELMKQAESLLWDAWNSQDANLSSYDAGVES